MWRSTERLLRAMHYERINGYLVSDHSGRAARLQQITQQWADTTSADDPD